MTPNSKNEIKPVKAWSFMNSIGGITNEIGKTPLELEEKFGKGCPMVEVTILPTAELERMREEMESYKKEYCLILDACEFMREDESLGLTLGQRIIVDGVKALKKQRDEMREVLELTLHHPKCDCGQCEPIQKALSKKGSA
jgi:hypothetical protein